MKNYLIDTHAHLDMAVGINNNDNDEPLEKQASDGEIEERKA